MSTAVCRDVGYVREVVLKSPSTNGHVQVALLRQAMASGRLVVLVQALTTPTLVAAAAADAAPGAFVQSTDVPAAIQVTPCNTTLQRVSVPPQRLLCSQQSQHCFSCQKQNDTQTLLYVPGNALLIEQPGRSCLKHGMSIARCNLHSLTWIPDLMSQPKVCINVMICDEIRILQS